MTAFPIPSQNLPTAAHLWFEEHLPELTRRCSTFVRRLPDFVREEASAEIIARVFQYLLSAMRRGKLHALTPLTLVSFFGRSFCAGRRMAGSSSTDVMSEATQHKRGFRVISLDAGQADPSGDGFVRLADVLSNSKAESPLENARRNLDFPEILDRQQASPKARRVFEFLAESACVGSQTELAAELGVSPPRITQLKGELADCLADAGYSPAGLRPSDRARDRITRGNKARRRRKIPLNAGTGQAWRGPK